MSPHNTIHPDATAPDPYSPALPHWFRWVLVAVSVVMLSACQSSRLSMDARPSSADRMTSPPSPAVVAQAARLSAPSSDVQLVSHFEQSPSDCPGGCNRDGGCSTCGPCAPCMPCNGPTPSDEIICDGGDYGPEVGVRADWSIDGLGQQDTVAHYDTLDGRVLVEPSNRVCIYAPRFGAVRRVVTLVEDGQRVRIGALVEDIQPVRADEVLEPGATLQNLQPIAKVAELPPGLLLERQQLGELEARVVVREIRDMIKPYCNVQVVKLGLIDNSEKPWLAKSALAAITWTGDQAAQVTIGGKSTQVFTSALQPGLLYGLEEPEPCLRLIKLASTDQAKPGEIVEFTLRFDNVGGQPIGNVTIVDNLATRLEYVPGSASASIEAAFSTSENGQGSLVLRWEIQDPLEVGKGGVLQFKARVR